jgi:hypothetical protein
MIHCFNCGANMSDEMLYCTSCGRKLDIAEQQTQVLASSVAPTSPYATNPETNPATRPLVVQKKKAGALKAVVITLVSLGLIGAIVVVAGVMFWRFNQRRNVTVNANIGNRTIEIGNIPDVNVNAITSNTNAIIDNAMKELQKAANDALAAANKAAKDIPAGVATGKKLDGTTRINFKTGATSATAVGTVEEEATFVLRAKSGQTLNGRITSPGGCIKFEDGGATTALEMEEGDNYLTVTNTCGKPTSMVVSVTIK